MTLMRDVGMDKLRAQIKNLEAGAISNCDKNKGLRDRNSMLESDKGKLRARVDDLEEQRDGYLVECNDKDERIHRYKTRVEELEAKQVSLAYIVGEYRAVLRDLVEDAFQVTSMREKPSLDAIFGYK